jgi:hypothetical protein
VVDVVVEFVEFAEFVEFVDDVVGVGGAARPTGGGSTLVGTALVGTALVGTGVATGATAPPSTRIVHADATATTAIVIPIARRRPAPFATCTSSV